MLGTTYSPQDSPSQQHEREQFSKVIELSVGGTYYTTNLSTLIKEEGSRLADLFSGKSPIYKDKDGRYFLDGDGKLFRYILDYLRADIMPFQNWQQPSSFGFGHASDYNTFDKMAISLHNEAVLFGLEGLKSYLEQFKCVYIEQQLKKYRDSRPGYEKCFQQILDVIPADSILGGTNAHVVIAKDREEQPARCCEHNCSFIPSNCSLFGGPPRTSASDFMSVKVPFEVDHMVLNCLYLDLTRRGFNVTSGITECNFCCLKEPRTLFGSTSRFGGKPLRQCCKNPIFYMQLNFQLAPSHSVFDNSRFHFGGGASFGGGTGFGSQTQTGMFGSPSANNNGGGLFGSQSSSNFGQSESLSFGGQQNNQTVGFGSQKTDQTGGSAAFGGFGSQQNSGGFGTPQSSGGFQLNSGGFGTSTSQSSGAFRFQQNSGGTSQSPFGGFGSNQNNPGGFGSGGIFGGGAKPGQGQSQNTFSFSGKPSPNQNAPSAFAGQGQQTEANSVRGGTLFGSSSQPPTSQSPKGFSFGSASTPKQASTKPSAKPMFGGLQPSEPIKLGENVFGFGGPPTFGKLPAVFKDEKDAKDKGPESPGSSDAKGSEGDMSD